MSWKIGGKFYRRTDFKMTLWYVLTFLGSAIVVCLILYVGLRYRLLREVDQFLLDETTEMERVLSKEPKETYFLMRFEDEVMARKYYPFFFQILDPNGKPLYVSEGFREIGYELQEKVLINAGNRKETLEEIDSYGGKMAFRIISTPVFKNGKLTEIMQLGTRLYFVRQNLSHFRNNILAVLPVILVLGTLGGWVLARRSLAPIGYIASKAENITSKNLSERLTPRGTDDEMDVLIRTINEMIARLESSFNRMAEFTADASHELKTPICAMRGEAEVLLLRERNAEEYQEGLAHFIEQFDHLNQMINDLILLSKADTTQVELKMTPLRLDHLMKNLCNLFQVLAEQKNIALETGPLEGITVIGDKVRLQQLFTNLIDNAIKYTYRGAIHITVEKDERAALVKIIDTGMGIPEEEREKIFKRFYRMDKSRSRETGGVGLGLSIAEWIVHAHQGSIEVDSEVNRGSTFTVSLPLRRSANPSRQN
ncbi:MAG TPA: ATP-binding protein [Thermodesulfobacteriota bacterium]|nr:ATP-binding protein [Thermodesulfobacteriota bacterium]